MEGRAASAVAARLAQHPGSQPVLEQLRGVVKEVLATRVPDGAVAAVALDENDSPVIVAVAEGRALRVTPIGESSEDFTLTVELLRFAHPDVRISADHVAVAGFTGGLFVQRSWRYELGAGRTLRFAIDADSNADDEAVERALAEAAGWPPASRSG
jgi:hypothetical protein